MKDNKSKKTFNQFSSNFNNHVDSLRNLRVLKKNMLFVQTYDEELGSGQLSSAQIYQCCGKVQSIKAKQNYKNWTTYVTFEDARSAALTLVGLYHADNKIRVLFGTMQYCKFFIRKAECRNEYCVFLHVRDRKNEIVVNDEIEQQVYQQHYDMALKMLDDYDFMKSRLQQNLKKDNILIQGLRLAADDLGLNKTDIQQKIEEVKIIKNEQQNNNTKNISYGDYIAIKLIKKLIRESSSKMHLGANQEQISTRSKMMLYQIVKR